MALRVQDARDYIGNVPNGAAISVGNSAQGDSTELDEAQATSGGSITLNTAEEAFSIVDTTTGYARLGWTDLAGADEFMAWSEGEGISGLVSSPRLIDLRTAGDVGVARLEVDTNRRVYLYAGSTQVALSGAAEQIPTAAGWRVELWGKVTGGLLRARLITASDGKSNTALWDSGALSSQPMGSTGVSWARFGALNTGPAGNYLLRNFGADTVNAQPGPYYRRPVVGAGAGVTGTDFAGAVTTDPLGLTYSVTGGTVISGPITNGDLVFSGHLGVFPTQAEEVVVDWTITDQNGRSRVKRVTYPAGGGSVVEGVTGESMWTGTGWVNI